jgi:hypothetical protein
MNPESRIPRSRGGICGVLLILLGLWGGLAPFVGPYFHFGFTPDKTWHYDSGRLYFAVIPGAAALLGGLLVVATRNRGVGIAAGVLAALGGGWFIAGGGVVTHVLKKTITAGNPIVSASNSPDLRIYLETVALLTGVGILILFVGALAVGRFSMVAARDLVADDAETYYPDFPAGRTAGQADLSQYPSVTGQIPATTGQFGTTTGQFGTPRPFPPTDFAPAQFPDTTTGQFPPPDSTT